MLRRSVWIMLAFAALMSWPRGASATGLLVPKDRALPPLVIKNHRVEADVEGHVATTHVTQVFRNNTNQRMEGTYIFPIPADAALTDFAMMINGKRQSGEVLPADKARSIYEDIVRRMKDPGLLEYMEGGLLRMRVFPIEPKSEVKVDVTFSHALPFESGVYQYTFPLKTGTRASTVQEDFTLTVRIAAETPIRNVYSPTHDVGVSRKDEYHAVAGFEQSGMALDTDFQLLYALTDAEFGLNLLAHRVEGQDGYFALMLSPRVDLDESKILPKDVCFVMDTSGSMQQENRIGSAKDAARFCIKALNPKDRFQLITFSSAVDTFTNGLVDASSENVEKALAFVSKIEARGGTDLCGALLKALGQRSDGGRPYMVVLLTDGQPTVGVTEPDDILAAVRDANAAGTRVFTFGIAENLDVPLLDRVAEATRGYPQYVQPGRDIEDKVSAFYRKVSNPVLANLALDFGGVRTYDVYPGQLPDLFRGSQLLVFGRYEGDKHVAVKLTGAIGDEVKEFAYDATFPEATAANGFLPQLWARRKIAFLLDQVRLHGQSQELTDEIVRLSREHGIATPYTSYLVLEDEKAYRDHGIVRGDALGRVRREGLVPAPSAEPGAESDDAYFEELSELRQDLEAGGRMAADRNIAFGEALRAAKGSASVTGTAGKRTTSRLIRAGARNFVQYRGAFVDTALTEEMKALRIKFGSDAYFTAFRALPEEVRDALKLGDTVVVVINGRALFVADDGEEDLSAAEIKAFFED